MTFVRMKIELLKINEKKMIKLIREAVRVQMRVAARAFIRAAVPRIPVDSGMSRGAFMHLGRTLRVEVPISPVRTNQKYQYPPARGAIKSPSLGGSLTTVNSYPSAGITLGQVILSRGSQQTFRIRQNIFHFTLNDLYGSKGTGPWQAMAAGRTAFIYHMRNKAIKQMPGIDEFIMRSIIEVDGRGLIRTAFKDSSKDKFSRTSE